MSARWDVVGIGANSVDHVLVLPEKLPSLSQSTKVPLCAQLVRCGGQTATAMAACAALGLKSKYIGVIGRDENARMVREALAHRGIDSADLIERDARTQTAVILVHAESGSRIVLSQRDPRLRLGAEELPMDLWRSTRIVHVDDVDVDAAIGAARAARAAEVAVTSDIDRVADRTDELIAAVTFPIIAEDALEPLTGSSDPETALRAMRRHHPGVLCATLGAQGVIALDGDCLHRQPAFPVIVRDTTGAGDVFRAGFIYGLLQRWNVPQILRFATAAAAASCTRLGAIEGAPTLEEVERLLKGSGR